MHSRRSPRALPALRRRQPRSLGRSDVSPTSPAKHTRNNMLPPTEEMPKFGGSVPPAAAPAAPAAASTEMFGHPWNMPTTLHSLAASAKRESVGTASAESGNDKSTGSSLAVSQSLPLPCPTTVADETATSARQVIATVSTATVSPSLVHPHIDTPSSPSKCTGATAAVRVERLRELEDFLQKRGGRGTSMEARHKVIQKVVSLLPAVYPLLTKVAESIQRYMEDVAASLHHAATERAEALQVQEKELYKKFETFFEGKIRELLLAKKQAEAEAQAEHAAAFALRQERDVELMAVKEQLIQRMNTCEKTEDEFRDFRHLISSVFNTNQQLSLRIEQLEEVLARHRIELPPASEEMMAFQTSLEGQPSFTPHASNADGDGDEDSSTSGCGVRGGRNKSYQLPVQFMAAAKQELVNSRLTLQEELLHSAFDDHSAYRMRITGLKQENLDLNFTVSELEAQVRDLYSYIHEKRFVRHVDEQGSEIEIMTPRPHGVSLALQTELGIDLRHSTADILSELSTLSINMKHQLNSALLRARQLHTLSAWLDEGNAAAASAGGVGGMLHRISEATAIPVFPVAVWPSIPHFLRTSITPDVPNYFWTEAQVACVLHNFFKNYRAIRCRARFVRDSKMLAPRVYQLFEHREVLLARLDASKEDVAATEENMPFGYVVTQFAREVLANLSPKNVQPDLPLVLPGTVALRFPKKDRAQSQSKQDQSGDAEANAMQGSVSQPTLIPDEGFTVKDSLWKEAPPIVEFELARFTYNLWYAAVRHQSSQPLCELFLNLVDGRLPIETFDLMEAVLGRLQRCIERLDSDGTRRFAYSRLVKGIVGSVSDMDAKVGLRAVQAVARAFEANYTPLHGGTLGSVALFADETYCMRESLPTSSEKVTIQVKGTCSTDNAAAVAAAKQTIVTPLPSSLITNTVPLPKSFTASSPPSMLPPIGATYIVRFCRQLVHDTLESLYSRIEETLCPLVEESEVVLGLYLLPLPRAKAALAALDEVAREEGIRAALVESPETGADRSVARVTIGRISAAVLAGAHLSPEAMELLRIQGLTNDYMKLLESRKSVLKDIRAEDRYIVTRMVDKAVQGLPHLKTSTHFPFRSKNATWLVESGGSEDGDEAPRTALAHVGDATSSTAPAATSHEGGLFKNNDKKTGMLSNSQGTEKPLRSQKPPAQGGNEKSKTKTRPSPQVKRSNKKRNDHASTPSLEEHQSTPAVSKDDLWRSNVKALLVASEEGNLVEWYSLRHALRRALPSLPWKIFQLDEQERVTRTNSAGCSGAAAAADV
ncbi:hypothetical protein, conserved [Leishmania tarentolae]|uniref:Uncharacterized protein n=1 Tax=Leishmania tarentolae TaxID=5689 RepID=A0A640KG36_LEITA|nr:hypothetical protein, conserved [Leishmania tarentolae]